LQGGQAQPKGALPQTRHEQVPRAQVIMGRLHPQEATNDRPTFVVVVVVVEPATEGGRTTFDNGRNVGVKHPLQYSFLLDWIGRVLENVIVSGRVRKGFGHDCGRFYSTGPAELDKKKNQPKKM
jgi:hypothetical protein